MALQMLYTHAMMNPSMQTVHAAQNGFRAAGYIARDWMGSGQRRRGIEASRVAEMHHRGGGVRGLVVTSHMGLAVIFSVQGDVLVQYMVIHDFIQKRKTLNSYLLTGRSTVRLDIYYSFNY